MNIMFGRYCPAVQVLHSLLDICYSDGDRFLFWEVAEACSQFLQPLSTSVMCLLFFSHVLVSAVDGCAAVVALQKMEYTLSGILENKPFIFLASTFLVCLSLVPNAVSFCLAISRGSDGVRPLYFSSSQVCTLNVHTLL